MIRRFVVAVIFLMLLANDLLAQQMADNKTKQVVAVAPGTTGAAPIPVSETASDNKPSELTDRERLLLDRIDKLEHRLADLESRSTAKPPDTAQPASTNMAAKSVAGI